MISSRRRRPRRTPARRGSIYVLVLGIGLILSVIAVSALTMSRLKLRMIDDGTAAVSADLLARSAAERALAIIENDPGWRTRYEHGVVAEAGYWGGGKMGFTLYDGTDGDLSDDNTDAVRVIAIGRISGAGGDTTRAYGLTVQPWTTSEVLNSCAHGPKKAIVHDWGRPTLQAGPVTTDGKLDLHSGAQLSGDAECHEQTGDGVIVGELQTEVAPKALPTFDAFSYYREKAVDLGEISGSVTGVVITPAFNGLGDETDPEGVYFIDTGGSDLDLRGCRVHGTLVIDAEPGKVHIDDACFLAPYRSDYPVLIVRGEVKIRLDSESPLSEATLGVNLNPPGAAYAGSVDHDTEDEYPNEVRGLVHAKKKIQVERTSRVYGVLLSEDHINLRDECTLVHDPTLWQNPPEGYASSRVISWTREAVD